MFDRSSWGFACSDGRAPGIGPLVQNCRTLRDLFGSNRYHIGPIRLGLLALQDLTLRLAQASGYSIHVCEAQHDLFGEHLLNRVGQVLGHVWQQFVEWRWHVRHLAPSHVFEREVFGTNQHGGAARQALVENGSERIHVANVRDTKALNVLWAHVD